MKMEILNPSLKLLFINFLYSQLCNQVNSTWNFDSPGCNFSGAVKQGDDDGSVLKLSSVFLISESSWEARDVSALCLHWSPHALLGSPAGTQTPPTAPACSEQVYRCSETVVNKAEQAGSEGIAA